MTERRGPAAVLQHDAAAAIKEVRKALGELRAALQDHQLVGDVIRPAERLVQGIAGYAELAVTPLAQLVDRQRELADQMAEWAELQREFADRMAAWAERQRQLVNAMDMWLAPLSGATHLTTRVLHDLAGEEEPTDGTYPRG